jgi:type III pantothenate kinase
VTFAGLVAIDVGSSRIKAGWYASPGSCTSGGEAGAQLPIAAPAVRIPDEQCIVAHRGRLNGEWLHEFEEWLEQLPLPADVRLATVHPSVADAIDGALRRQGRGDSQRVTFADVPLAIDVAHPERVGIDRLLNAVAVNRLRRTDCPAIAIDLGTAVTVDWIDAQGVFMGGAILPGLALAAGALHRGTAALPELAIADPHPPALGKSTEQAIAGGVYWGTVGAIVEIVRQLEQSCAETSELFVTGGDAPIVLEPLAQRIERAIRHVSHLVLAGIDVTAAKPVS